MESAGWLTLPNLLTLLRLLMIVPFVGLAVAGDDIAALAVFVLAGLTDIADGWIARRFGQASKWGRLVDPFADKLLTGTAYVVLALFRDDLPSIPLWVAGAVILRDVLILTGSLAIYSVRRNDGFKPSVWGKLNTFIELGVVTWFLSGLFASALPSLYLLLLASLVISAAGYVRVGVRMLRAG